MEKIFRDYPYTDFHEMNLDWIIGKIKELNKEWDDFKVINQIQFKGEWNITESYQSWNLVSNNNIGYISVQAVPAGISITNTDYWKPVADYSALLADMQSRIVALEGPVERMTHPKFLLVGNSLNFGTGGVTGKGWGYYLVNNYGYDADLIRQPGGDFVDVGNNEADYVGKTYREALTLYAATLTQDEKDAYDYVVIAGGYNDRNHNYTDVFTEAKACINYVKTTFTNAKIIIIPLSTVVTFTVSITAALDAWSAAAGECGAMCASSSRYWLYHRSAITASDNLHLSDNGYKLLASYIHSTISSGEYAYIPKPERASIPAEAQSGDIFCTRTSTGVVQIFGKVRYTTTPTTSTVLTTIPEEFRPASSMYQVASFVGDTSGASHKYMTAVKIDASSGEVTPVIGHAATFEAGTFYPIFTYTIDGTMY